MRQAGTEGTQSQEGTGVSLRPPHRVHAPCQHLRDIGLDVLEEQLVISQEAVEDARVLVKVSFLSQVQVEVLGIFFSCGAGRRKGKRVRLSVDGREGAGPW